MLHAARRVALIAAVALTGLAVGGATPAHGASFTVNATHDAVDAAPGDGVCADADGACTLRAAVEETNVLPGPDAIAVPAGTYVLTVRTARAGLELSPLLIKDSLSVQGSSAATTAVERDPETSSGRLIDILPVNPAITVVLSDITLRKGLADDGGALRNRKHSLSLDAVILDANEGGGSGGGGIWNSGTLTIVDSAIIHNLAQEGGAIFNASSGHVRLLNSTISANQSISGTGAVKNTSENPVVMENVTMLETAPRPDGVAAIGGAAQLKNTLIANSGQGANCGAVITSLGHNLSSEGSCNLTGTGDLNGAAPQLTGLQDNGGPTPTHGLYPGSKAIDAGDNDGCPATDQRGIARPQGAACDIGAYEYVPPAPPPPTEPPTATEPPPPVDTATAVPAPSLALRSKPSPSPSPSPSPAASASASARRPRGTPFTAPAAVLVDAPSVEEDSGGNVPVVASGLAAAGVLGLIASAAGGGFYWYRTRHRRR